MTYAIKVENLSKRYVIQHQGSDSSLKELLNTPLSGLNKLLRGKNDNFLPKSEFTNEEFWALKDVSFEVAQGAKLGVMGRNGAGKSTLLKILSRITEPTAGRISYKGKISSLLEVGTGFHHELSGRENVYLNGAILGMRHAEIARKFDEIVAFSEIEKFIDVPVKRYSSGMQVRLAFSVASHLEPDILVLDEVLAVGDVIFQKKCIKKMEEISSSGKTVIFVNHGVSAIKQYCDQAIVLDKGRLILDTKNIDEAINLYSGNQQLF
jgi:lipopolysaccharide transport system ATP-binding protein